VSFENVDWIHLDKDVVEGWTLQYCDLTNTLLMSVVAKISKFIRTVRKYYDE
jgi:hypothetical protein